MQGGWYSPHCMNPRPSKDHHVRRKRSDRYEWYHHLLTFHIHGKRDLLFWDHHAAIKPHKGRIVLGEIFILQAEPSKQVRIHHLDTAPLIYQHSLNYETIYSGCNHQGIIMCLNRALQTIIIEGDGLPSVLLLLFGGLLACATFCWCHSQCPLLLDTRVPLEAT